MNLDDLPPPQLMWEGKYVRALKREKWEYASRTHNISAVVILAEFEGKVILIDQPRVALDCRCIELPAGLVGDEDPNATPESTALKELEEETGFTAERGRTPRRILRLARHVVRKLHAGSGHRCQADRSRRWE